MYGSLSLLSAEVRVRLLRLVELEELGVGELAKIVQLPQSTVSRHLKLLRDAEWVQSRREGTSSFFAFSDALSEEDLSLWNIVRSATDGDHAEDGLRLASVLAARRLDSRAFFGRVAGRWSEVRRELFGDGFTLPAIAAMLPRDLVVADLGCGTGEMLAALEPYVSGLIGVDREPAMLEAARHRLGTDSGVDLREGSLEAPPLALGEVDVALMMLVLHHVDDPRLALDGVAAVLASGAHLVLLDMVAHDREEYRRTMGHAHLGFDEALVRRWAVDAGLEVRSWRVLAPDPTASGPPLFVAVMRRRDVDADA